MPSAARQVHSAEKSASDYIPYSHHVTKEIISTVRGEYLSVWKLAGRAHQSASQDDVFIWVDDLNNLLRGICSANVSLWTHLVRRRVREFPRREFKNSFARTLDQRYSKLFETADTMANDLYVTVIFRPDADKVMRFFAGLEKASDEEREKRQQGAIKALEEINATIGAGMKRYGARLLRTYDRNGYAYSEPLEFLASLINGEASPMPLIRSRRFSDYMATNRVLFAPHGEVGEIRMINRSRYFGMLEIQDYDDRTEPGQLNMLLEAKCELVLSQSFSAFSRAAAKGKFEKQQRLLRDSNDAGQSQIIDISLALDQLVAGQFVVGEHHGQLLIWGDSVDEVRDHMAKLNSALLDCGVVPKLADLAIESGFWSQLPANWSHRPRPAPVTSFNFLCFSSFHNFMRGKPTGNPWGDAATMFNTTSLTPLYFSFHQSPAGEDSTDKRLLGNTMIIGPSGGGKTVLLGFLLAQLMALEPRVVVFDKDRGMEVTVRALGGVYLPLKAGEPSGFNPFQLEPTPANLLFLKRFIVGLVKGGGSPVTHADEVEIEQAVETVMRHIDKPDRRMATLLQSLPNPSDPDATHPTVAARLMKWSAGGELGWLFDNTEDRLDLSTHDLYGFDVTEFLDNNEIRAPIMMYLLHRTEAMIDGRRFALILDEFWKLMLDDFFIDLVRNKLKTIRKQNGIVVFATQEAGSDLLESEIAGTLIQQCATQILLPNKKASPEDYINGLKLTPAEMDLLLGMGEESRQFLIKQGESAAVATLNLRGFDDELLVLSGTPDNAIIAEELVGEVGSDPEAWLPLYLQRVRKGD